MDVEPYRDKHGKTLADYPRPSVAVDTALLTVRPGDETLSVLQVRRAAGSGWVLPGTFLHPGERLADAVSRSLFDKAGLIGVAPHQLHVFDDPRRDERGWVLSVAHVALVPFASMVGRLVTTRLMPATSPGRMAYKHGDILRLALEDIRRRYERLPDPGGLLPDSFTMLELRRVHAAVAERTLQKDTFRKVMEPHLATTGRSTVGTRGRPAELFERAAARTS